jgi:hypothetical protein
MEQINPHSQLEHIVRFLDDLRVDTRHLMSALYINHTWSGATDTTDDEHLPVYLARLCERWLRIIRSAIPERNADILIRRYSLDSQPQSLLKDPGIKHSVDKERIRQLELISLNYLRKGGQREDLLQIALGVVDVVVPLQSEPLS